MSCGGKRELNNNWRGGKRISSRGYVHIYMPDHPKAMSNGYIGEHILVCERILGKQLPLLAVPHHVNGKKDNNLPSNLVICENDQYHKLLHRRERALKSCGHTDWRKCNFCKQYDKPENIIARGHGSTFHQSCYNIYLKLNWETKRKEE